MNILLGSHFEYVAEAHLSRFFSPPGFVAGLVPVGVSWSPSTSVPRPFVGIRGGFVWTDLDKLYEIGRRFSFLVQAEVGWRLGSVAGRKTQIELRLLHMSNAGTSDRNLGMNSAALVVGWALR